MAAVVRELFQSAVDITSRGFPTAAAARESVQAFRSTLRESAPIESVLKRVFGKATVRAVSRDGGDDVFRVVLHSGSETDPEGLLNATIRAIRRGDLESVAHSLNATPSELGSRSFRRGFKDYVRNIFPDVHIAEEVAATERALPKGLKESSRRLRPDTLDELLHAIRRDRELERLVTRLSEHIAEKGGTRFRYVSTFFVLTGVAGTVTAVASALHEQSKRAAGCWRLYLDPFTRQLRSCKILQASCRNKESNEGTVCERTPITFHADMCRDTTSADDCVSCDSTAPPDSKLYIAPSQYLDPGDMYVCRPVASVGEMLGRIAADVPHLARDVVNDVTYTVFRAWNDVKYFLLAGGFLVFLSLLVYTYLTRRSEKDSNSISYYRRFDESSKPLLTKTR